MSLTLILYIVVESLLIYILYCLFRRKIKHIYESYLIAGIIFIIIWSLLYISIFLLKLPLDIDIYRVRTTYFAGSCVLYCMLIFFYFYGVWTQKFKKLYNIFHTVFIAIIFTLGFIIIATNKFIESVEHNISNGESYEIFGSWYVFLETSYIITIVSLIAVVFYKAKQLSWIYKTRFLYMVTWYLISVCFQTIFISILPSTMDIWVMQKEQIIFFLPFLWGLLYTMHRYRFKKISFALWRICIFVFSWFFSVFIIFALKNIFTFLDHSVVAFWNLTSSISFWDIVLWNILFYLIHSYMQSQFKIHYDSWFVLQKQLNAMRAQIPFLKSSWKLNSFLETQFSKEMRIWDVKVFTGDNLSEMSEMVQYFKHDWAYHFFLNDIVFIEENKHKFSQSKILKQLDPNVTLYIPMYKKKDEILGVLCIWKKPFGDYYRAREISLLQDFAEFLTGHLTYMNIYSQINELNLTLDKKVDEKTIEYNNLINRQKDFIAYVGHEIRNPVTNTIFLCYDLQEKIVDQIWGWKLSEELKEDIDVLSGELKKVSDLSKKIFTTEKGDLWKIKLYKNNIKLNDFLLSEISVLEVSNPSVVFDTSIRDVWMIEIDEIQFRQVIQNLLSNALKFIPERKWKISIQLKRAEYNNVCIVIQDNGKWFSDVSNTDVFDKYRTWDNQWSGLGMWLYLCKKIVELHGGTIESSPSNHLWWACFTIIL